MTLPEAEDKLADAGLKLGAWNEIPTYESSPGRVVTQGPRAGEEADQDSPVDLIVSAAPPAYQPDATGSNTGGVGVDQYPGGVFQPSNQGNLPPAPF
jgi:beta-lactam-binding protein with PASTA domain